MPKASVVVLIELVWLVTACGGVSRRPAVADYVGEAVAAELRDPVRDLAQRGNSATTDAFDGLVDEVLDDLETPDGVLRLMEGNGIGWHHAESSAWASTSVIVVPEGDPSEPYCIAIGVHSDGRTITRPSLADPWDGCAQAREGDFD